jgi:hypothetical protein
MSSIPALEGLQGHRGLLDITPPDDPLVKGITCRHSVTIDQVRREATGEAECGG